MPNTAIIDTEQFVEAIAALLATERKALVDDLRVMLDARDEAAAMEENQLNELLLAQMKTRSAEMQAEIAAALRAQ
jgi:hypothetical protein